MMQKFKSFFIFMDVFFIDFFFNFVLFFPQKIFLFILFYRRHNRIALEMLRLQEILWSSYSFNSTYSWTFPIENIRFICWEWYQMQDLQIPRRQYHPINQTCGFTTWKNSWIYSYRYFLTNFFKLIFHDFFFFLIFFYFFQFFKKNLRFFIHFFHIFTNFFPNFFQFSPNVFTNFYFFFQMKVKPYSLLNKKMKKKCTKRWLKWRHLTAL